MKITRFWAKGFRSLHDVDLDGLGAFNVFYGPNGSGKSNVLAAIRVFFQLLAVATSSPNPRIAAERAVAGRLVSKRDVTVDATPSVFELGAHIERTDRDVLSSVQFQRVEVALVVHIDDYVPPSLQVTHWKLDGAATDLPSAAGDLESIVRSSLASWLLAEGYRRIDADRSPHAETTVAPPDAVADVVDWHLQHGRLKNALFVASTSADAKLRARLRVLRGFLEGAPLQRPSFDSVRDPRTEAVAVVEPLGKSDVSLDLAGLGIAQIYAVLAGLFLTPARSLGLEEPEAHLHAPTSGRHLRELLKRAVDEGHIDQLFIATHSNLFDLDSDRYWDVSLVDGATKIERKRIGEIDGLHLYEPGPAKHALMQLLRYAPEGEVVFRRPDGTPIGARDMISMLERDEPAAVEFVKTMNSAAMRLVRLQAQRSGDAK